MLDTLLFFVTGPLQWLIIAACWIVAIIYLKGVDWVSFAYKNPEEKQQLKEEYDFVRINRHFGGSFYLSMAVWLTFSLFINVIEETALYHWLIFVILCLVWLACLFRYLLATVKRRGCDQFRLNITENQINPQ